jgi:chaperonin GroES
MMTTVPMIDDCNPGFRPLEYYVVIAPAAVEEKVGSIIIPSKEEDKVAVQRGRIVAVSPLAFNFAEGADHAAAPGDVVLFSRYAGTLQKGADGKEYRLVRDKDVIAVMEASNA